MSIRPARGGRRARAGEQAGDLGRGEVGVGGGVGYGVHAVSVGGDAPPEALVVSWLLTAAGDDDERAAHGDALGLGPGQDRGLLIGQAHSEFLGFGWACQ